MENKIILMNELLANIFNLLFGLFFKYFTITLIKVNIDVIIVTI